MKKRAVEVTEVANIINEKLKKGAFLTSKSGDKVNSMVIGWGHIGRVWERPVFIAYVRTSRYTSELIDSNPEFTVNVPVNGFTRLAFALCGMRSGRDIDKISMAGLSLVEPEVISVPAAGISTRFPWQDSAWSSRRSFLFRPSRSSRSRWSAV